MTFVKKEEKESKPSFFAIIPADVRYCKDLNASAKLLYGEITALCSSEGHCWASNKYFADLYDVDVSTIQKWILNLKKQGFIHVQVIKKGMATSRKIWVSKNLYDTSKTRSSVPQNRGAQDLKNEAHISTSSNTEKEKKILKEKKPEKAASKTPQKDKVAFGEFVRLTHEQHQKLVDEFGKQLVSKIINNMNDYIPSKYSKDPYKSHYHAIRVWARKEKASPSQKKQPCYQKDEREKPSFMVADFSDWSPEDEKSSQSNDNFRQWVVQNENRGGSHAAY